MAKMQIVLSESEVLQAVMEHYSTLGYDVEQIRISGSRRGISSATLIVNGTNKKGDK